MASDLVPVKDLSGYLVASGQVNFGELIAANVGGVGINVFDLDTAKVPAGGSIAWNVQTLEGDDAPKVLEGVIIYKRPDMAYYKTTFDQRQGAAVPPDCTSVDGVSGVGDPGGLCARCPYNQFGSGPKDKGKACRERMLLFLLRPTEVLPMKVVIPTMSIRNMGQYFLRLASRTLFYHGVITELKLEKATSSDGIAYAKVVPSMAAKLPPEQAAITRDYAAMIAPQLATVKLDYAKEGLDF